MVGFCSVKGVSRVFQGCSKCLGWLKCVLRGFQDCFRGAFRMFQGCFKGVSKVFQGCFLGVSRKFQACVKNISRVYFIRTASV